MQPNTIGKSNCQEAFANILLKALDTIGRHQTDKKAGVALDCSLKTGLVQHTKTWANIGFVGLWNQGSGMEVSLQKACGASTYIILAEPLLPSRLAL